MFGGPMMMAPVNGNPQTCALVQNSNETVVNMIVADPAVDPAPEGYTIVGLPEGSPVTMGWIYNQDTGEFTAPIIDTSDTSTSNT